jgi:hypothetical protein
LNYKIWLSFVFVLAIFAVATSYWFTKTHTDWLVKDVPDSMLYLENWQKEIDGNEQITHPAILHWLPMNCLCRYLTLNHATQITSEGQSNGYHVFQLDTDSHGLGKTVELSESFTTPLSPIIIITRPNGKISYAGAYSDGVRCNTGTSMVYRFLEDPEKLPTRPLIGLDVKTCRCVE